MPKRDQKKQNTGQRNDRRPNGKAWKGGKAPADRKPGDKGFSFKYNSDGSKEMTR